MYYYVIAGAEKCSGTYYSVRSVVGAHTIKQEMQKILPSGNMTLRSFYLENWENKNNYCYAWRMVEKIKRDYSLFQNGFSDEKHVKPKLSPEK